MKGRNGRRCCQAAAAVLLAFAANPATAADHADAPAVTLDFAADIADFYAWHTDDSIVAVVTVGGFAVAGQPPFFDENVLVGIHVDTNGDEQADAEMWARFGQDPAGNWGLQVQGIPGATGPVEGPVDTVLESGSARAYAGLRDDPFFFDREGLFNTLQTETISFDNRRDWLFLKNVTAVVVEFPIAELQATGPLRLWGTTWRK